MALIISELNQIEDFFYTELQKEFNPDLINMRERVRIITDTQMYKDDDVGVWEQKTGRQAKYYQVYFDSEFCCGFDSTFPPEGIKLLFLRNLKQLVINDKVIINKDEKNTVEDIEAEKLKQKDFQQEVAISKIEDKNVREIVKSLKHKNGTAKKTNEGRA